MRCADAAAAAERRSVVQTAQAVCTPAVGAMGLAGRSGKDFQFGALINEQLQAIL